MTSVRDCPHKAGRQKWHPGFLTVTKDTHKGSDSYQGIYQELTSVADTSTGNFLPFYKKKKYFLIYAFEITRPDSQTGTFGRLRKAARSLPENGEEIKRVL